MDTVHEENRMGIERVDKLLLFMSAPMIVSMLVQALYNIVDYAFVSRVSEDALTAVSLCFPIQNLLLACSVGTNIGVSALLSRSLGEKKFKYVNRVASVSVFLSFFIGFIFLLLGVFFAEFFFERQNVDPLIQKDGMAYLRVVTIFSVPLCMQIMIEKILSSTGKTKYTMYTQVIGAMTNIILDPIFIFVLHMGVRGAAIATVIGQSLAMCVGLYFNYKYNPEVQILWKEIRPDFSTIKRIYKVGFPSVIMQSIGSFTLLGLNLILIRFSTMAVAFFGIYFKVQTFIILPILGLSNGLIPIVAYNYGARKRQRIVDAIKYGIIYSLVIMSVGCISLEVIPEKILGIFNASEGMLQMGVPAARIMACAYIFAAISIIVSSTFQALGNGVASMISSLIRQVIVLLPLAYFFAQRGNIKGVWASFVVSEFVAFIVCVLFSKVIFKKFDFVEDAEMDTR